MKIFILIISTIFAVCCFSGKVYPKELPVKFLINGDTIHNAQFYMVVSGEGHLLRSEKGKILLPDTLPSLYTIILIYKNYRAIITVPFNATYLEIYYDRRIFHNLAKLKSGENWLKYIFKKRYLVIYGNGMESICHPPRNDYLKRVHIE